MFLDSFLSVWFVWLQHQPTKLCRASWTMGTPIDRRRPLDPPSFGKPAANREQRCQGPMTRRVLSLLVVAGTSAGASPVPHVGSEQANATQHESRLTRPTGATPVTSDTIRACRAHLRPGEGVAARGDEDTPV